ncbi:hypothetical protein ACODUL_17260 [Stenotrophomonas maltophilia]
MSGIIIFNIETRLEGSGHYRLRHRWRGIEIVATFACGSMK